MAILSILLSLVILGGPAGAAVRRTPTQAPSNTVVDGPDAAIDGLSGLFVARDGSGGLVYLKDVGGVAHVFASTLSGGAFQSPRQLDVGLGGASSQPVITGNSNGELMVAFINGGELYTVLAPSGPSGWQGPQPMYGGASNPSLSMNQFGKAYLAFTASGAGGGDVRTLYFDSSQWGSPSAPFDMATGDRAGTGTGRPRVVACGDGTGIVVWGEAGHVYVRRVVGNGPSVAAYRVDPGSFAGFNEVSADSPVVGAGGDSSYASIGFQETLDTGAGQQTRVLYSHLIAGRLSGTQAVDGVSDPAQSADQPATATTEFGAGFVTAEQTATHNLYALRLGSNAWGSGVAQINSQPLLAAPDAVTSPAGTVSTMIAWQQNPGSSGPAEIRLRYAPDGINLNPEQVLSSSSAGPTDADRGLAAGGDLAGDAAVAWVQGTGAQTQIIAAQLFQNPGSFAPLSIFGYSRSVTPTLAWSPASELWGSPTYQIKLDGALVAQTTATAVAVPAALTQGRHTWQVTAVNRAGGATLARSATVLVDSLAPTVKVRVTGQRHPRVPLHAFIRAYDTRPGLPAGQVSGVTSVQVKWGDGFKRFVRANSVHAYRRRATFRLTVIAIDRAGNRTVVTKKIRITAVPKKKRGKTSKHKPTSRKHTTRHGSRR